MRSLSVEAVRFQGPGRQSGAQRCGLGGMGAGGAAAGHLRLALEDLPTLLEFDLVCVDADTDPALLERIKEEGVMLYAADEV